MTTAAVGLAREKRLAANFAFTRLGSIEAAFDIQFWRRAPAWVGYKDDYAAYVDYQMRTRPISLVITSDKIAQPSGGEEIKARGLTFHYDSIQGLMVITWSDRGLTYALVSDLDQRGQESCVVCHQGASDQDFIAPLKSK
ncbi:MAG TPA: hypothetical protein VGO56_21055 [Pyrinomonadaceae bacterium]|nr:hypothetical protein [Pyrinomonadaceae bacterium]